MDMFFEVLKWTGIVLAAGFIGYFGRYLAMRIIDRIQEKKAQPPPTTEPAVETPPTPKLQLEQTRMKIEKKKAKAEAKRAKKGEKD